MRVKGTIIFYLKVMRDIFCKPKVIWDGGKKIRIFHKKIQGLSWSARARLALIGGKNVNDRFKKTQYRALKYTDYPK